MIRWAFQINFFVDFMQCAVITFTPSPWLLPDLSPPPPLPLQTSSSHYSFQSWHQVHLCYPYSLAGEEENTTLDGLLNNISSCNPWTQSISLSVLAFFHFCHPGLLGREMSWWVKFLQCKHEDFSSDPTQAKGQEQLHPRVIPAQKSGDQRIMGSLAIHFTPTLGSRFSGRLWLKE